MKKSNLLKLLALALSLLALLSFAACGNSEKDDVYISSDIYETDNLISDDVTGETEGTEFEEDVFETPESESSKGGSTATSSNSGTAESSKVTSSKDNDSKKEESNDNEAEKEGETSSETGLEVTEDGTIKLPPVKLY